MKKDVKKHKLPMTRLEFLDKFVEEYSFQGISPVIPAQYPLIYALYTVLMECNLRPKDISFVSCDGENVVARLQHKDHVKEVVRRYTGEELRLGYDLFQIQLKADKCYLHVTLVKTGSTRKDLPAEDAEDADS